MMIKLSDYLNYLSNEIIQARKAMDLQAISNAKQYSEDEYLKYFKAPRFTMPSIKLELPIAISELDSETKFDFKMDEDLFLKNFNHKIFKIGEKYNVALASYSKSDLAKRSFQNVVKDLEKNDDKFIINLDDSFNKVDLNSLIKPIHAVNPIHPIQPVHPIREFTTMDTVDKNRVNHEIHEALIDTMKMQFIPVETKLKNIFIAPDTNSLKESGDDKILVKLNVELVEENLQIIKMTDNNGKEYEEIIID